MNNAAPPKFGMGAPVRRKEDKALVTGAGRFTDDYTPEGTLRAVVLRSSMAHARFKLGELADVRSMPGVRLVMTHADLGGIGGLPCKANVRQTDGTTQKSPYHPLLCKDVVRHVGDPIAFVVADTAELARSAAESMEVDYEPLTPVVDMKAALKPDAAIIWPELGTNVAFECSRGEKHHTDEAFSKAAKVTRVEIVNNRVVANYMETRGIVAEYDKAKDRLHPDARHAGRPWHARHHCKGHPEDSGEQDPRHHAGCRRRVRHQGVLLPRVSAVGDCGEEARPSGEVDW